MNARLLLILNQELYLNIASDIKSEAIFKYKITYEDTCYFIRNYMFCIDPENQILYMFDIITCRRTDIFKLTSMRHLIKSLHNYKDKLSIANVIEDNGNIWIVLSYEYDTSECNKYILKFNKRMKVRIYPDIYEHTPFSIFETKKNIYVTSNYFSISGKGPRIFLKECTNNIIYSQTISNYSVCNNYKFCFMEISSNEFIKIDRDGNRKKYKINETIFRLRCNNTLLIIQTIDDYCSLYDMKMCLLKKIKYKIYNMSDKYIIKDCKDPTFIKFNLKLNLKPLINTEYKHILRLFTNLF